MIAVAGDNKMLGFELLSSSCPHIFHFVTTRQGGCSEGAYTSFNCTDYTGDTLANVLHNRKLLCEALPQQPSELIIPYQVHGTEVRILDSGFSVLTDELKTAMLYGVDALVTDVTGYCLCISTADCVPVLLYDPRRRAIAAVHAGWRGTVQCILQKVLGVMAEVYGTNSQDLLIGIGPSISSASFEVGEEVWQVFAEAGFEMSRISFRNEETGKWHIDLWKANQVQLLDAGVDAAHIEIAGICTYQDCERFFSARRLGIKSGRILSGIQLVN